MQACSNAPLRFFRQSTQADFVGMPEDQGRGLPCSGTFRGM